MTKEEVKIINETISDLEIKIRQRCILEGCRYSPYGKKCIYCGDKRRKYSEEPLGIIKRCNDIIYD